MKLQKNIVLTGYWLFRWRSYFPILLLIIFVPAMAEYEYVGGERGMTTKWGILSLSVGMIGLFFRILVVGHTPQNTSGREGLNPGSGLIFWSFNSAIVSPTLQSATDFILALIKPISPGPSSLQ